MRFTTFSTLGFLLIFFFSCSDINTNEASISNNKVAQHINSIQKHYAPDRRVARFDIDASFQNSSWILTGETNLPQAKDSLVHLLSSEAIPYEDQISVWPESQLNDQIYAIARHSVANMRSERGHSQELATQVLLGTPLQLLKQEEEWFLAQCPDGYIAWIHGGEIARKTATELDNWKTSDRVIFLPNYGHGFQDKARTYPISDLVKGDILERLATDGTHTQIAYPDGRTAFVLNSQIQELEGYLKEHPLTFERTLAFAQQQIGKPYLWGGTSPKAMDCSGFTKTLYAQQGLIIPRDASQQVQAGIEVSYDDHLVGLEKGDLLFFGRYREDGSEKITHVGLYVGHGRFIHSGSDNGANKEQSLLPDTPDYAAHRRATLLRARRLTTGSAGVLNMKDHPWYQG